jgi:hypothetical protein
VSLANIFQSEALPPSGSGSPVWRDSIPCLSASGSPAGSHQRRLPEEDSEQHNDVRNGPQNHIDGASSFTGRIIESSFHFQISEFSDAVGSTRIHRDDQMAAPTVSHDHHHGDDRITDNENSMRVRTRHLLTARVKGLWGQLCVRVKRRVETCWFSDF